MSERLTALLELIRRLPPSPYQYLEYLREEMPYPSAYLDLLLDLAEAAKEAEAELMALVKEQ